MLYFFLIKIKRLSTASCALMLLFSMRRFRRMISLRMPPLLSSFASRFLKKRISCIRMAEASVFEVVVNGCLPRMERSGFVTNFVRTFSISPSSLTSWDFARCKIFARETMVGRSEWTVKTHKMNWTFSGASSNVFRKAFWASSEDR